MKLCFKPNTFGTLSATALSTCTSSHRVIVVVLFRENDSMSNIELLLFTPTLSALAYAYIQRQKSGSSVPTPPQPLAQ